MSIFNTRLILCAKLQIKVDRITNIATAHLLTCHEAVSCWPWLRRPRFFKVAIWTFVLWNVQVRVLVFHCQKQVKQMFGSIKKIVFLTLVLSVRVYSSHRNPSSALSPPLSVCVASSSECFQLPERETWRCMVNAISQQCQSSDHSTLLPTGATVTFNFITLISHHQRFVKNISRRKVEEEGHASCVRLNGEATLL